MAAQALAKHQQPPAAAATTTTTAIVTTNPQGITSQARAIATAAATAIAAAAPAPPADGEETSASAYYRAVAPITNVLLCQQTGHSLSTTLNPRGTYSHPQ